MASVPTTVAGRVHQRHGLTRLERCRQLAGDRQRQRNRPGIELAVVFDDRFVEHALVGLAVHGTGQRAQRAVGKAIDRRQVGVRNRQLRQRGGFAHQRVSFAGSDRAVHRFGQSTVGRDQIAHVVCSSSCLSIHELSGHNFPAMRDGAAPRRSPGPVFRPAWAAGRLRRVCAGKTQSIGGFARPDKRCSLPAQTVAASPLSPLFAVLTARRFASPCPPRGSRPACAAPAAAATPPRALRFVPPPRPGP